MISYAPGLSAVVHYVHSGHRLCRCQTWSLRQYANDCQLHMSVPVDVAQAAVDKLSTCLVDVEVWPKASHLRFNPAKSQVVRDGFDDSMFEAKAKAKAGGFRAKASFRPTICVFM